MYDIISEINNIMCIPRKEWTESQEKIMKLYADGRYYYPTEEELEEGANMPCQHEWVTRYLLTSSYEVCKLCGEERGSGVGIGVGGMNRV